MRLGLRSLPGLSGRGETEFVRAVDIVAVAAVLAIVIGSIIVRWFRRLDHDVAHFLALAKMLT